MTEQEWLVNNPPTMMDHITKTAAVPSRRLRLLAIAWARFIESQPDYSDAMHVSHLGEEVVEGRQTLDFLWDDRQRGWGYDGDWSIANIVLAADAHLDMAIRKAMFFSENGGERAGLDTSQRWPIARSLILCVLGNPFRPVALNPSWLVPTVTSLAQAIYDDRHLPSGHFDNQRMGVLADALEELGCDSADLLNHCRSEGPHVRGCWLIDILLGKS